MPKGRGKMNLVEELKRTPFQKNEDIEYLKNSNLPLVLYGAGELAEIAKRFFDLLSIKFKFVVIDKEYWTQNIKFHGIDVMPLEDILANNSNVDILIAFLGEKAKEKKELLKYSSYFNDAIR
jgi:hypothetical protein